MKLLLLFLLLSSLENSIYNVCGFSIIKSHTITSANSAVHLHSIISAHLSGVVKQSPTLSWPTFTLADENSIASVNIDNAVEISDLPPPYVPLIIAVLILLGVGLLTGSLGDVYSEEASLGFMSGAKAKKEAERSRSSYFKNK